MKPYNLKTTTTHPWASTCRRAILTSAKVNVTRLLSHASLCHVLVLSRNAVVLLGNYVAALISGLWFVAFGEEFRWLKKFPVLFYRNLNFCFYYILTLMLKETTWMFTIEAYVLYKLISKLRNEYNLSNILQKKLRQKKYYKRNT